MNRDILSCSNVANRDVFFLPKAPSYRVAKNLFSETKNQDQKPINAKICFFSLIGHVGTRAIFSKSTAADKKSWKGTWEVKSRTPVECMLCCTFAQARVMWSISSRLQKRSDKSQNLHQNHRNILQDIEYYVGFLERVALQNILVVRYEGKVP